MELRHIYNIATVMNNCVETEEMIGSDINDIEIKVSVSPSTLYGIDREFYRQTHDNSMEGFEHKKEINAIIDNVHFSIVEKKEDGDQ